MEAGFWFSFCLHLEGLQGVGPMTCFWTFSWFNSLSKCLLFCVLYGTGYYEGGKDLLLLHLRPLPCSTTITQAQISTVPESCDRCHKGKASWQPEPLAAPEIASGPREEASLWSRGGSSDLGMQAFSERCAGQWEPQEQRWAQGAGWLLNQSSWNSLEGTCRDRAGKGG